MAHQQHHYSALAAQDRSAPRFGSIIRKDPPEREAANSYAQQVASHYDRVPQQSITQRSQGRDAKLRQFQNWVKSTLLRSALERWRDEGSSRARADINILDIACGKGGDLPKYDVLSRTFRIRKVVFVDVSRECIDECRRRFEAKPRQYEAEFHVADCADEDLSGKFDCQRFQIATCQFAIHYAFQTVQRAQRMIFNLSSMLSPGGLLVGTTTNALEIVRRLRSARGGQVGNSLYRICTDSEQSVADSVPLFNGVYHFQLSDLVDFPEFFVHPTLLDTLMTQQYMMARRELSRPFNEFFDAFHTNETARSDLANMNALTTHSRDAALPDHDGRQYSHVAASNVFGGDSADRGSGDSPTVGTLGRDEWEVVTLYSTFAYEKLPAPPVPERTVQPDPSDPYYSSYGYQLKVRLGIYGPRPSAPK